MLARSIENLQDGDQPVEILKGGYSLVIRIPGGRPYKASFKQSKSWDAKLILLHNGTELEAIEFDHIFDFFNSVKAMDPQLELAIVREALQIGFGAEPNDIDVAVQRNIGGVSHPRTSEYILKAIKWLYALEDRKYLSECNLSSTCVLEGRAMLFKLFLYYVNGVPISTIKKYTKKDGPPVTPSEQILVNQVDLSPCLALKEARAMLHQLYGLPQLPTTLIPAKGRHQHCKSALEVGVGGKLGGMADQAGNISGDSDDITEAILKSVKKHMTSKGVEEGAIEAAVNASPL